MRKTPYGPEYCDACGYSIRAAELRVLKAAHCKAIHLGCLSSIDKQRTYARIIGVRCLFCGARLLLPDLVDHFNREHGRVLVNW